jgi:1,4-alpha-glucan branching enzyme
MGATYYNSNSNLNTNLIFILNSHIPHVLQQGEVFNEQENWIFEAITETYIPLLDILSDLDNANTNGKQVILSFTPCTIQQMLEGRERYFKYLEKLRNIAFAEVERTSKLELYNKYQKYKQNLNEEELKNLNKTARFYLERIERGIQFYERNNILEVIKGLKNVRLWTSCPNHTFLPMCNEKSREYFIKRGIEEFEKNFDREPEGFWLPECGFYPGIEKILVSYGIKFTNLYINAIGLYTGGEKSGIYEHESLKMLVSDFKTTKCLWNAAKNTIPSNAVYREFFRDLGFDVTEEYLTKLDIPISDKRKKVGVWTGLKYHAISGNEIELGNKAIYDIDMARNRIKEDVKIFFNFLNNNRMLVNDAETFVMPFDTEIFGHWWLEGTQWLKEILSYES